MGRGFGRVAFGDMIIESPNPVLCSPIRIREGADKYSGSVRETPEAFLSTSRRNPEAMCRQIPARQPQLLKYPVNEFTPIAIFSK